MSTKMHNTNKYSSESNDQELDSKLMEKVADYLKKCGIKVTTTSSEQSPSKGPVDSVSMSDIDPVTLNYLCEYVQSIQTQDVQTKTHHEEKSTGDDSVHSNTPFQVLSQDDEGNQSHIQCDHTQIVNEELLLKLDPFQRIILEKIDEQNRKLDKLQNQVETISKLIAMDLGTKLINVRNHSNQLEDDSDERSLVDEDNNDSQIVVVMDALFDMIMYIPRRIYNYFTSSRLYRLLSLLQREARQFQVPGNPNARFFDIHLLIKVSFVCIFLNARMQLLEPHQKSRESIFGEMLALWKTYRTTMVFISGIIVYCIQSGLIFFIVHIVFKDNVIRRVWNDEDLVQMNHLNPTPPRHRGRRERDRHRRQEEQQEDEIHDEEPPGQDDEQADAQLGRPQNIQEIIHGTFLGGVIGRPNPNRIIHERDARFLRQEEIVLYRLVKALFEGFLDALYLFGSFFLSLLPMWHPRPGPEFPSQSKDLIDAILNDDLEKVSQILLKQPDLTRKRDKNGWEPLHEAVRAGKRESIEVLLSHSADINARTGVDEKGGSVLWWAMRYHDPNGDFVSYLREKGAIFVSPGQDTNAPPLNSDESNKDNDVEHETEQDGTVDEE